ncbi:MAG: HEAT repeat domain-containing protein [Planctomycetota bacterium]
MENNSKQPELITRRRHYAYVLLFTVYVTTALSILLSFFFPNYREYTDVGRLYNLNLLWFVPAGLLFGWAFGLVINRWMLVIYSKGPATEVPVSVLARAGRFMGGWRFLIFGLLLVCFYIVAIGARQRYYYSVINYRVPGLDAGRPEEVRQWTLTYIGQNPKPEYIIPLASFVFRDDVRFLENWGEAMRRQSSKKGADFALHVLSSSDDPEIRNNAARGLYYMSINCISPESMYVLFEAFRKEEDDDTIHLIEFYLRQVGNSSLTYPLIHELKNNKSDAIRPNAASLLCVLGNEDAVQPVLDAIHNDESENLRAWACLHLQFFGSRNISVTIPVEPMLEILQNGEKDYSRMFAAHALGLSKDSQVIDPLIRALENDKSKRVRSAAACAIQNIGGEKAIKALEKAVKNDPEQWVREAAEAYLRYVKEEEKK